MNRHTMKVTERERQIILFYRQMKDDNKEMIERVACIAATGHPPTQPRRADPTGRITVINTGKRVF